MKSVDPNRDRLLQRRNALSTWETEGGAIDEGSALDPQIGNAPPLTNTDLMQLRIRVIALENVVISLLARSSIDQLELVREMADYISPRPGATPHPMTVYAAKEMKSLVDRAHHFHEE